MRVTLNYKTLSKGIRNALSEGAMDLQDVKALRKNVEEYIIPKKKWARMVIIMSAAMILFMLGLSVMNMRKANFVNLEMTLIFYAVVIVVLAVVIGFTAWLNFGKIITQYNSSLKKGYPQMYEELKL
ncbi:hypothetical protein D6856_03055 [Butyrivibrio sp. XB500-5]|uniref:hypothetical protein n=1 Tax=Butyrivibrio sp. XB500-5 TaxID=2364880 RepID=UPI000EA89990|nr:hypothetical protein [Butyrivibrio sp. XB500-5]RKM63116.1 hypothetical protein D6856_03055 [Butyrivibrio sp. XB500-5]